MDKLSAYYKVKIKYMPAELDGMKFTGNIAKNDSLPVVLKVTAQMNGLEVIQQEEGFSVRKR